MKNINKFKPRLEKQYLETNVGDFCIFFNSEGISFEEILTPIAEVSFAQVFFFISNCGGTPFVEI